MINFLKNYFNYSRGEIRGIVVLMVLNVVIFLVPGIIRKHVRLSHTDFSSFEKQIDNVESQTATTDNTDLATLNKLFFFDPNTVSKIGLMQLGLTEKQVKTFIKFREAGGQFEKADDLKKVYSINDELFTKLKPFIKFQSIAENIATSNRSLPVIDSTSSNLEKESHNLNFTLLNINKADSNLLMTLSGIGPVLSKRIVNYRKYLGGYYRKEQLREVYGLDEETYDQIKDKIIVDTSGIKKINLNRVDFKTLNRHPYLSYADTKTIIKYREIMGEFTSKHNLLENHLVDSATYNKISVYLTVY